MMVINEKIEKLINCINNCNGKDYIEAITNLGLSVDDFEGQIHFSEEKYTRTCIANEENFELILLAWSKGQKTPIHNHDGKEGFVYALEGMFREVQYNYNETTKKLEETASAVLLENQVAYAEENINGFHSIENLNDGNSLSLHLYVKPILNCLVYNEEKNEISTKSLAYDFK